MFCEEVGLRNFAKFTGIHLSQSLFFNKVAGLRPATLFKKRFWYRCFPISFAKFASVGKKSNVAFTLRLLLELAASIFPILIRYLPAAVCF